MSKTRGHAYYVVLSGEKIPKPLKKDLGSSVFASYAESLKKKYEVFRIKIPGLSSFLIFTDQYLNYQEIVSGYYGFLEDLRRNVDFSKFSVSKKQEINNWFTELLQKKNPIILVAQPYVLSIVDVFGMLQDRISEDQKEKITQRIISLSKKQIRVYEVKISYLFETADFSNENLLIFKKREQDFVNELCKKLKLPGKNPFTELLEKQNFLEVFCDLFEKRFPELKGSAAYNRLKELITSIQVNFFGIVQVPRSE